MPVLRHFFAQARIFWITAMFCCRDNDPRIWEVTRVIFVVGACWAFLNRRCADSCVTITELDTTETLTGNLNGTTNSAFGQISIS